MSEAGFSVQNFRTKILGFRTYMDEKALTLKP